MQSLSAYRCLASAHQTCGLKAAMCDHIAMLVLYQAALVLEQAQSEWLGHGLSTLLRQVLRLVMDTRCLCLDDMAWAIRLACVHLQERLSVRREQSQERPEQRRAALEAAPEKRAVTDLRDLLSRNKRSRDGERDEGHSRPSIKSRISRG